jgi:hypothetical protein
MPVIHELQKAGCEVLIAGSGPSLQLLRMEFPSGKFFEIPSYGVTYSRNGSFALHLASQAPRILSVIKKEHKQVLDIAEKEKIDFVISDNRYGCYHESIPSAIIIHQLSIQAPPVFKRIINYYNHKFIRRFAQCWVPDTPDRLLSGDLSGSTSISHKFIGPLSRMKRRLSEVPSFELLGLVSGPEPHRTTFDKLLAGHLKNSSLSYKMVRGIPSGDIGDAPVFSHLPSTQLNDLIEAADVVICRSGYSTIMDLAALGKKAIFVPTPGQTEQLYLAREMERKKIAPMVLQKSLSLPAALERLKNFSGFTKNYFSNNLLQTTLREFLG